jgi:hypothetical protein
MRGAITAIFLAFCALALGGCGSSQGRPPSDHAYLDMYDRPPPRARKAQAAARISKPPESTATVGSAAPATTLRPYSPEWWEAERAREKSENERLKRVMQICRGC